MRFRLRVFLVASPLLSAACAGAGGRGAAPLPAVTRLRCEYAVNPLGIDEPRPRLGWVLESSRRGEVQTAYHILVASGAGGLAAGRGDLWDSGWVASGESTHVEYGGPPLPSAARAWWKVRVRCADGAETAWSVPAWWETGLLSTSDWKSSWIAFPSPPSAEPEDALTLEGCSWMWFSEGNPAESAPPGFRYFRRRFELPADRAVASAECVITADDSFELFVNGVTIGSGTAWRRLHRVDVARLLAPGANALAVKAGNGGGPAGLIARLRVRFAEGAPFVLDLDAAWRAADAAPEGWAAPAFDDSGWAAARPVVPYGAPPWERPAGGLTLPPAPLLRREFVLDRPVRRARLYASALGLYEARLNGRRVGDDCLTPGWTDYRVRVPYQTYDVTDLLRPGPNAVGLILADGWYAGYVGFYGHRERYGPRPWARAQLVVTLDDGTERIIGTDGAWRAAVGPILEADLLMGETYDARRERTGWDAPGVAEAGWAPVTVGTPAAGAMVAPVGPPVRRCEEFPARGVVPAPGGAYIFDVGQNIQGWARLQVAAPAGTRLVLRYAEVLNPDGSLHTVNLRTARATDTYVCRGGGEEVWEPRYTVHGFRYVEIAGLPKPPAASAVTGIAVRSDVPEAGTFACSSDLVNRLHHCIVWTLRGNFLSVPTDCPQRDERLGWMGDGQVFAPTACFLADAASFYTKWVTDMRDAQSPAGAFSDVAPRVAHDTDGAPGWADAGVAVPWTVHRVYGDRRILERHYGAMARWVAYVREGNPDGIWRERAARNYGDWISIPADATPKEVMATAFFARSVGQFARIAEALGRAEDAARHRRLFEEVRAAFNRTFVNAEGWIHGDPPKDPQTGARRGDTQTVYALALRFGLLPEDRRPAAARRLVELIEANGGRLSTGFPGTAHLLPALTEAGHLDVAYRLLLQERWPSWGHMVRSGATTIWERWDGWTPERGYQDPGMNSFNHYALGAVGEWLFETVGGIGQDPDVPGWRRIVIRPRPGGGLTWAKATYESIRGRIESAWERKDGEFALRVVIPPGAAAAIHVPAPPGAVVTEGGRRAEEAPGVRLIRRGESEAVYEAGAGRYEFRVREGPG